MLLSQQILSDKLLLVLNLCPPLKLPFCLPITTSNSLSPWICYKIIVKML